MVAERVPLTFGYNYNNVVGSIEINEDVTRLLADGQELLLAPSIREDANGKRTVVGLTLLTLPAAQVRSIYD